MDEEMEEWYLKYTVFLLSWWIYFKMGQSWSKGMDQREGKSPLSSWVLNNKIYKRQTNRRKRNKFYSLPGGLIEKGAQKWPKHAVFVLFRQRNNTFVKNWLDNDTDFGCASSDSESALKCRGHWFNPWSVLTQGTKIPHAVGQAQGPQLQNLWATAKDSTWCNGALECCN